MPDLQIATSFGVSDIHKTPPAVQEIHHVHFHLVPRIGGDGVVTLPKSGARLEPAEAAPTIEAIKSALAQ